MSLPVSGVQPVVQTPCPAALREANASQQSVEGGPALGVPSVGRGDHALMLAGSPEPWVVPKLAVMVPAGMQRTCSSGQSEEEKEEAKCCMWRPLRALLKCGPDAEGCGSLRNRAGAPIPNLSHVRLGSLQRGKQLLAELGEGEGRGVCALTRGTGHKEGSQVARAKQHKRPHLRSSFPQPTCSVERRGGGLSLSAG